MTTEDSVKRRVEAAEAFNRHENRGDAARVTAVLADGLSVLCNTLYRRVHYDVQRIIGMDSMLAPVSEERSEKTTKVEIELYQIAVSAAAVRQREYVATDDDWYLQWLTRLRLGEARAGSKAAERLAYYLSKTSRERRLAFTDVLANVLAESRKAPLVLFRLVPPAVEIVTALAFGDRTGAAEARNRQMDYLPPIRDCRECRGGLLAGGEQCEQCGNPLWKFDWLMSAD